MGSVVTLVRGHRSDFLDTFFTHGKILEKVVLEAMQMVDVEDAGSINYMV